MENKKSKADKNKKAKARVARINRTKAIVQNELEQELREEGNINKTTESKVHKNKKKVTPIKPILKLQKQLKNNKTTINKQDRYAIIDSSSNISCFRNSNGIICKCTVSIIQL